MITKYRDIAFRAERRQRIDQLLEILADYPDQRLTSRQVFYQYVVRALIENDERNYKLTTKLITDARYAGLVDWEVIEDRGREPDMPSEWSSIENLVEAALRGFRLPRWKTQDRYVELWVEKQALAGVLAPIAQRFHVPLMVNKGYSSASAMKSAADRMNESDNPTTLLYLGDHDPSGEDMVRDIEDRLTEFGVIALDVIKVGLTIEQVRRYNPPPNPAKVTDSRAKAYIEKYGAESWELDALPPRVLNRLVTDALEALIDRGAMNAVIEQENADKARLRAALHSFEAAS